MLDVYNNKCFYVSFDIPLRWTGALENARLVVERSSACAARCRRREQRVQTEFILCCELYQNTQVIRCCRRLSPRRSSHLSPALSWQAPPRRLNFGRHLPYCCYTIRWGRTSQNIHLHHDVVIFTFGAATGLPQASSATMPRRAPAAAAGAHLRRRRCRRRQRGAIPFSADSLPSALQGFPTESGH